MVRYKMSFDDGVKLYGKYVGNWGGAATRWRFDAKNGDTVVKSVTLCPSPQAASGGHPVSPRLA